MNILNKIIKEVVNEALILEIGAADLHNEYYKEIPENVFKRLISADPTAELEKNRVGKFSKWILNLYKKNKLKMEDLYKVTEYLNLFIKYNQRIEDKNINNYKTLPDLFRVIEPFTDKTNVDVFTKKKEAETTKELVEKGEIEIFYNDKKYLVLIPKTRNASCHIGGNTQWCTSRDDEKNMFDHYKQQGNMYVFIDKNNPKVRYQLHLQSGQFSDVDDDDYYADEIINPDVLRKIIKNENLVYVDINVETHEDLIKFVDDYYNPEDRRGNHISKESIMGFLNGDYHYDHGDYYWDIEEMVSQPEVKNEILKTLNERGVDLQEVEDMDDREFYDYLGDEHDDIQDNLRTIYRYAAESMWGNEFYKEIKNSIRDLDDFMLTLQKYDVPVSEETGFAVNEPHYGFDSYVTNESFLEHFKDHYEF